MAKLLKIQAKDGQACTFKLGQGCNNLEVGMEVQGDTLKAKTQSIRARVQKFRDKKLRKIRRKMMAAQRSWYRIKKHVVDKDGGVLEEYQKTNLSWFFLLCDTSGIYYVFHRFWDEGKEECGSDFRTFDSESEAREFFRKTKDGSADDAWVTVDDKISQAQSFIKRYLDEKESFYHYPLMNLDFMFALAEVSENGSASDKVKGIRRNLAKLLKGISFDCNERQYPLVIREILMRIAGDVGEEGFVTQATYKTKAMVVLGMVKILSQYTVYRNLATQIISMEKMIGEVLKAESYDENKDSGTIVTGEHFKYIEIVHLRKILDKAWAFSPYLYNYIILGLSSGLRPSELWRLQDNHCLFVISEGFLDYKAGRLVKKTKKKADTSKLVNPALSIVSRLILFHDKTFYDKNFFKKKAGSYRMDSLDLEIYVERCLRTTCATMMAYCEKIEGQGRASLRDAQYKLGHMTLTMLLNVYARKTPPISSPIVYFDNWGGKINMKNKHGENILLTKHTNLWDAWLLNDYLDRKFSDFNSDPAKKDALKEVVIKESRAFNAITSGDGVKIKSSTF